MLPKKLVLRLIAILVFSILIQDLSGQQINVELLEKNLAVANNDTLRVDLLNQLGKYYAGRNPTTAMLNLNEAVTLARKLDYKKGLAKTYLYIGRVQYYKDDFQSSFDYYYKAYPIFTEINDLDGLSEYYFYLGELNRLLGDYVTSVENYQNALELHQKNENLRGTSMCYNSMGKIHQDQKNYEKAFEYFNKSLEIKEDLGDQQGIPLLYSNIGELHQLKGDYDAALHYFTMALEKNMKYGGSRRMAISWNKLGEIYCNLENFTEAELNFNKSMKVFKDLEDYTGQTIILLNLSNLYMKTNRYNEAEASALKSLEFASQINNSNLKAHCLKALAEVYAGQENYDKAYHYLETYKLISDSIFSTENERRIADLEVKYQSAKKDKQINALDSENKIQRQNQTILIISLVAFILLALLFFISFRYRMISLKQKNQALEKEKDLKQKEAELKDVEHKLLSQKIEKQNKDLVSRILLLNKTHENLAGIIAALKNMKLHLSGNHQKLKSDIDVIIRDLEQQAGAELWKDFEMTFQEVHTGFYENLLAACGDLTPTEIKIAALLRLNLSTKEIEAITFKSESSIKSIRFRLRKKLGLEADDNLISFLMKL